MAATAEAQAQQTQANAARNAQYIFEDAAYQNNELLRDYSSLLGQQENGPGRRRTDVLFGHGADDFKKQPLKRADGSGNVK